MDRTEIIRFCAKFWQVDPAIIAEDLKLDDRSLPSNSSIRFYQFVAKIEAHINKRISNINNVIIFGDLFRDLESN